MFYFYLSLAVSPDDGQSVAKQNMSEPLPAKDNSTVWSNEILTKITSVQKIKITILNICSMNCIMLILDTIQSLNLSNIVSGHYQMSDFKRVTNKKNRLNSNKISWEVVVANRNQEKICKIWILAKVLKSTNLPTLSRQHYKEICLIWAKNFMKTVFSTIILSDESRATLDEFDGWVRVWSLHGNSQPLWRRGQKWVVD